MNLRLVHRWRSRPMAGSTRSTRRAGRSRGVTWDRGGRSVSVRREVRRSSGRRATERTSRSSPPRRRPIGDGERGSGRSASPRRAERPTGTRRGDRARRRRSRRHEPRRTKAAAGLWPADARPVVPGIPGPPGADRLALMKRISEPAGSSSEPADRCPATSWIPVRSSIRSSVDCAAASGCYSPASTTSCTSSGCTTSWRVPICPSRPDLVDCWMFRVVHSRDVPAPRSSLAAPRPAGSCRACGSACLADRKPTTGRHRGTARAEGGDRIRSRRDRGVLRPRPRQPIPRTVIRRGRHGRDLRGAHRGGAQPSLSHEHDDARAGWRSMTHTPSDLARLSDGHRMHP